MHHKHGGKHHRRNPSGGNLLWGVGGAVGGFLVVPMVGSMLAPSGIVNYAVQGGAALAGGWLLGKWKKPAGWGFLVGGLAGLAIKVYGDMTSGAAVAAASPGTSYYAQTTFPVPTFTHGNPNKWPAFAPGGSSTLPVGTSPATSASVASTGGNYTPRLRGRFSN